MKHTAYIGVGSNLGDREENIREAIKFINESPFAAVTRSSKSYDTEPLLKNNSEKQPRYLNAAFEVQTILPPHDLLKLLIDIEAKLGRPHPRPSGTARTIDLDILLYDEVIMENENLQIPHPGLQKRLFVLLPLCDIAPGAVDPISSKEIRNLKEEAERKEI